MAKKSIYRRMLSTIFVILMLTMNFMSPLQVSGEQTAVDLIDDEEDIEENKDIVERKNIGREVR